LIDIRAKSEGGNDFIPGAVVVPRAALADHLSKINKASPVYLIDTSGYFSQLV
jgi:rhodanese-related sulfurtransferase